MLFLQIFSGVFNLINTCVVGCGNWGKNHVRVFAELGVLHSVVDFNMESAKSVLTQNNSDAKIITFEDAISDLNVDIIIIATPVFTHFELALRALEAGKHVLVEKPIALSVGDAETLVSVADAHKRILMVGHILQYHSAYLRLKELCDGGALGEIHYIYSNRLNLGQLRTEENILWSFAPHDISMILSLADSLPSKVYADGHARITNGIPDSTVSTMTFESGLSAHMFVSWLHPFKEQRFIAVGDDGMIVFDDTQPTEKKLGLFRHSINRADPAPKLVKAELEQIHIEHCEPLSAQARHLLDCIKTGKKPRTDGVEGTNVLRVLDAAQRSLLSHVQEPVSPLN